MIPPDHMSLQTLLGRLAKAEKESGEMIRAAPIAASKLRHHLRTGSLRAFRCDPAGVPTAIPADEWLMDSADFQRDILRDGKYIDVFVENVAAEKLAPAQPSHSLEGGRKTRGRPPNDLTKLCAAVALAVHEDGRRTTQAETIKKIRES